MEGAALLFYPDVDLKQRSGKEDSPATPYICPRKIFSGFELFFFQVTITIYLSIVSKRKKFN
jgi:hypothetical protein